MGFRIEGIRNERMEKHIEKHMELQHFFGRVGTTVRIHSFMPCYLEVTQELRTWQKQTDSCNTMDDEHHTIDVGPHIRRLAGLRGYRA